MTLSKRQNPGDLTIVPLRMHQRASKSSSTITGPLGGKKSRAIANLTRYSDWEATS